MVVYPDMISHSQWGKSFGVCIQVFSSPERCVCGAQFSVVPHCPSRLVEVCTCPVTLVSGLGHIDLIRSGLVTFLYPGPGYSYIERPLVEILNFATPSSPFGPVLFMMRRLHVLSPTSALQFECGNATNDMRRWTPQAFRKLCVRAAMTLGPTSLDSSTAYRKLQILHIGI